MRSRSVWELDEEDEQLIDRIAAGIGRTPARLLAYLLLRTEREAEPATSVSLQIGTGVNRTTISETMPQLESRDLVERTTVRVDESDGGRPRTAWRPTEDVESTVRKTYDSHANALLDLADEFQETKPAGQRARSGAMKRASSPLKLAVNWRPNPLHMPIYAAISADWYDSFDVDIRLAHHDGSRRALERVVSGPADLALVGAATAVRARAAGEPIVPVAVCYQRAMTVLYTVRDVFGEPLQSVDQLEGRRIGMPPDSETRVLGQLFLSQTTFADDVQIVDTNGEERKTLLEGDADVVTGSFADPQELERQGLTVDALLLTDHFPIYGPTIVVSERTLDARPSALSGMLAGTTGGWATARRDPGPAAERIAAVRDDPPDRIHRTFERAAAEFGESEAVREQGWGWHRPEMWDRLRTALEQGALLRDER